MYPKGETISEKYIFDKIGVVLIMIMTSLISSNCIASVTSANPIKTFAWFCWQGRNGNNGTDVRMAIMETIRRPPTAKLVRNLCVWQRQSHSWKKIHSPLTSAGCSLSDCVKSFWVPDRFISYESMAIIETFRHPWIIDVWISEKYFSRARPSLD